MDLEILQIQESLSISSTSWRTKNIYSLIGIVWRQKSILINHRHAVFVSPTVWKKRETYCENWNGKRKASTFYISYYPRNPNPFLLSLTSTPVQTLIHNQKYGSNALRSTSRNCLIFISMYWSDVSDLLADIAFYLWQGQRNWCICGLLLDFDQKEVYHSLYLHQLLLATWSQGDTPPFWNCLLSLLWWT